MSADVIQAKYDSLDAIASRFSQQSAAIVQLNTAVKRRVEALEGGWEGKGSAAFFAEMNTELFPALQRLRQVLDEGRAVTLEAKATLERAEQEAAALFKAQPSSSPASPANGDGGSFFDTFWKSFPGQQGLAILNFVLSFVAGSGHEVGEEYGPGAKAGSIAGDMTSSFAVWGDVRDLLIEAYNAVHPGREVNELNAILSGVGLAADLGWLDGIIPDPADGANAAAAVLKTLVKQIDELPKPVRDRVAGLIKWGVKNPSRLGEVTDLVQWTLKHHDTELGAAMLKGLHRGAIEPDWFTKSVDASQWLKKENPQRFRDLAFDPDHGKVGEKSIWEAHVGLSLEESGKLKEPIIRDPQTGRGEFIEMVDGKEVIWDVKSFNSKVPGRFNLNAEFTKMEGKLRDGENFILDTTDLGPAEIEQVRQEVVKRGWSDHIKWYP